MKDPNLIYPGKDPDFVFPEEGPADETWEALQGVYRLAVEAGISEDHPAMIRAAKLLTASALKGKP